MHTLDVYKPKNLTSTLKGATICANAIHVEVVQSLYPFLKYPLQIRIGMHITPYGMNGIECLGVLSLGGYDLISVDTNLMFFINCT